MMALGVDACRAGWVAVRLEAPAPEAAPEAAAPEAAPAAVQTASFAGAALAATLTALPDWGTAAVIAIDIPLGLLETGWRTADIEAAAAVGPRRGSVFRVPPLR